MMRLFVAIEIPTTIREELRRLRESVSGTFPPARWVRTENLHLTLDFLGEQTEERLAPVAGTIERVTQGTPPMALVITRTGTFPRGRPARVAWVGLCGVPELLTLQCSLQKALDSTLERQRDDREFHPHLTLARPRRPWPRRVVEQWEALHLACGGAEVPVTYLDLMQSHLSPSGPTYERVRRFSLEG